MVDEPVELVVGLVLGGEGEWDMSSEDPVDSEPEAGVSILSG